MEQSEVGRCSRGGSARPGPGLTGLPSQGGRGAQAGLVSCSTTRVPGWKWHSAPHVWGWHTKPQRFPWRRDTSDARWHCSWAGRIEAALAVRQARARRGAGGPTPRAAPSAGQRGRDTAVRGGTSRKRRIAATRLCPPGTVTPRVLRGWRAPLRDPGPFAQSRPGRARREGPSCGEGGRECL